MHLNQNRSRWVFTQENGVFQSVLAVGVFAMARVIEMSCLTGRNNHNNAPFTLLRFCTKRRKNIRFCETVHTTPHKNAQK